jgi:hypothetical protein
MKALVAGLGLLVLMMVWLQPGPVISVPSSDCVGQLECLDVGAGESGFVGQGAMVMPGDYSPAGMSRAGASECPGCEWRFVPRCAQGTDVSLCAGATIGCPPDEVRMRVLWRESATVSWSIAGEYCAGDGDEPVPLADVGAAVRDRFEDVLPRPEPDYEPPNGALANVPAVFDSGQRGGVRVEDFQLNGLRVELRARPSWRWDFGDGTRLRTDEPGGAYPDTSVTHTYRSAGEQTVTCVASWTGTFTVDGLGPFDVTGGPVTQTAELDVTVRESAGRLTG